MAHVYICVWRGLQVDKPLCTHATYVQASVGMFGQKSLKNCCFFFSPASTGRLIEFYSILIL